MTLRDWLKIVGDLLLLVLAIALVLFVLWVLVSISVQSGHPTV